MSTWAPLPEILTERLAVTLLHFLWQGIAVALGILVLGWLLRVQRPTGRYALSLVGLLVMAACPLMTFWSVPSGLERLTGVSEPIAFGKPSQHSAQGGESKTAFISAPRLWMVPVVAEDRAAQSPWLPFAQQWIVYGWMLGATILGGRLLVGWLWLHWLRGRLEPVPTALAAQAEQLCRALHLRVPRLNACRHIHEAIATGLLRPLILFPVAWLTELPPDMLEAILAHELAHLCRWDLWVNALQRLIETLLFYHPAVWWLSRRLRVERELCCDELAVLLTQDRLRYVQTLERVGRLVALGTHSGLALTMGGTQMTLLLRVKHLLAPRPARLCPTPWLLVLVAVALPLAGWWFALRAPLSEGIAAEPGAADVTGTVIDSANQPVSGLEVQVYKDKIRLKRPFRTDPNGQFHVPAAWRSSEAEHYTLVVRDRGRLGWFDFGANLTTSGQELAFRIKLLPLDRRLQGTLLDDQGNPLAGVPVLVTDLSEDTNHYAFATRFANDSLFAVTSTDQQGQFHVTVPSGTQGCLRPGHADWMALRIRWQPGQDDLGRIQLAPAGRIEGRVVDALTGRPLADVSVGAQAYNPDAETGGWGDATTDAKGEFVIGGLRPGPYNALFEGRPGDPKLTAPATEAVNVQVGKPAHVEFRASRGRLLTGKVLDVQTGKPMERCYVGYYGSARPRSGAACLMVQTDIQGNFRFYVPAGVSYLYVADGRRMQIADSHRTIEVPADRDLDPVVLKAGPINTNAARGMARKTTLTAEQVKKQREDTSYRLQGVFRSSDGRPVTKVELRLVYEGNRHSSMSMASAGATIDVPQFAEYEDGRKAFLLVEAEGFAPTRSPEFTIARTMPPLTIDLKPPIYVPVRGRVLDQQSHPVAGARVRVGRVIYFQEEEFPWGLETKTNDAGRFELKHLRVGDRFYVRIDKPGTGGALSDRIFLEKHEPVNVPELRLGPLQTIRGQVTDSEGEPVPGAKLVYAGDTVVEATASAQGQFALRGLPTGKLSLTVSAPGFGANTTTILAGTRNAEIHLWRPPPPDRDAYRFQVELQPADGKTVAHTQIWFLNQDEDRLLWWTQFQGNKFENNVEHSFRKKLGGTFAVVVAAEGYAQPKPVSFTARKNAEPLTIDLQPAAAATVHGQVVSEQGEPIAGAKVGLSRSLLGKEADEPWHYLDNTDKVPVTDAQGHFQITGLQPGSRVAVYVNKPGYAGVWSPRVSLGVAEDLQLPNLVLKKATRRMRGQVVSPEGKPVAKARVSIADLGVNLVETVTDANGRFLLRAVPEQEVAVRVDSPDYEIKVQPVEKNANDVRIKLSD
jgi:beta-lactamase regulating signal transducer with metallopeptidase domain/protocatechuate 3,4-dioxygenase beta subunit